MSYGITFSPFEMKKLFKMNEFNIVDILPFEGLWEKNINLFKILCNKYFSQSLYCIIKK